MYSMLRNVLVFVWVSAALGRAQSTGHGSHADSVPRTTLAPPVTSSSSSTALLSTNGTGTCPSRTVNYITHTLAQQCLRTDRVAYNGAHIAPSSVTDATGTFATSVLSDDQPQVTTVTYAVANGTTTIVVENSATAQPELRPANSPTTSFVSDDAAASSPPPEEEVESALDIANFLSFEDWKKQNLAKSGQSPDDVGRTQTTNIHRPRPVNNALDTLGDEQEIDIDFAAFGGVSQPPLPGKSTPATEIAQISPSGHSSSFRSKDAGKTCKERTNYASFDCAATVLKSNKEAKSATSVLVESKDSYLLNKCSADNKFIVVELCNDIQIDTVVLANYEFFSSGFRHFRISVSDRYPVKMEKWRDLGTFEARNTREIQAFLIENPQIWARYLRIEFLTHYGTEYYCPVSLLRVHGITMMEDYRHQEELASGEVDDLILEAEAVAAPPVHQEPAESTEDVSQATMQAIPTVEEVKPEPTASQTLPEEGRLTSASPSHDAHSSGDAPQTRSSIEVYHNGSFPIEVGVYAPANANMTCALPVTSDAAASSSTEPVTSSQIISDSSDSNAPTVPPVSAASGTHTPVTTMQDAPSQAASSSMSSSHNSSTSSEQIPPSPSGSDNITSSVGSVASANNTAPVNNNQAVPAINSTRAVASSASSPPPAQPSTQESFFKSVHKRLQQLESNSTLSLQYIEEQSRLLREAFGKVEKRQVSTTSKFLAQLNETVMVELHGFRQAYDQLWQSTVIELEGQRETYQREMLALSTRLTMVADELVWQKRMGIVQSTLLLMCLALVLFGRSSNGALEMPLMQQLLNKSTTALSGWDSPPNSPSPHSRSPVSLFRRKLWGSSTVSADPQYPSDDGEEGNRPGTREGPNPEINIEAPSPPQGNFRDEWENGERSRDTTSPDSGRKGNGGNASPSSPGKRRKKNKKSLSGFDGAVRPTGHGSPDERTRSPLVHDNWAE